MVRYSKIFILLFLVFGLLFGMGDRAMAACVGGAPDGTLDVPGGEQCDGGNLDGKDCSSQGFAWGGSLGCTGACVFDTSCCFNANPCNQDPTVVITPVPPATGSAAAGGEIEYTVTVTNNDSNCGMCPASRNFDLTDPLIAIDPNLNHSVFFNSNPLTVNAGGNSSTTFGISSNITAGMGAYTFTVQATGNGNTGTGNGTFTVTSVPEICDNGVDTNGDGNLDTGDDDGDGDIDCLDIDCLGHPNCCGNGTKEAGVEACDSNADCPGAQICNMHCSACIDFVSSKKCPDGFDDCDCDGICETNVLTDINNCGMCGTVCGTACINGSCVAAIEGGLVPCGRMLDNKNTVWNEREDCKICHLIILADSITEYLLEIVGIITVLSLVIGGMLYVTSSGNPSLVTTAKTAFRKSLYGFVIVFIAWVITNTTMVLFGFNDPLGDGSWHKFDCDVSTAPTPVYTCGDGIVTSPNDNGILEECDPKELLDTFIARKTAMAVGCGVGGGCPNGCFSDEGVPDPDCPFAVVAWVRELYSCNHTTCDFGCATDPLVDEIGGGCYLDINGNGLKETDECQKGRYTCDFATDTVFCENTYNNLSYKLPGERCEDIYDYCCVRFNNPAVPFDATVFDGARIIYPGSSYSCWKDNCDGFSESGAGDPNYIQMSDFTGKVLQYAPNYYYYTYDCDTVCKNHGGDVCIGVGLGDLNIHSCYNVRCDSGASCFDNLGNVTPTDCSAVFRYWDSHSCWDDNIGTANDHVFPVGSTACICK